MSRTALPQDYPSLIDELAELSRLCLWRFSISLDRYAGYCAASYHRGCAYDPSILGDVLVLAGWEGRA